MKGVRLEVKVTRVGTAFATVRLGERDFYCWSFHASD